MHFFRQQWYIHTQQQNYFGLVLAFATTLLLFLLDTVIKNRSFAFTLSDNTFTQHIFFHRFLIQNGQVHTSCVVWCCKSNHSIQNCIHFENISIFQISFYFHFGKELLLVNPLNRNVQLIHSLHIRICNLEAYHFCHRKMVVGKIFLFDVILNINKDIKKKYLPISNLSI